MGLLLAFCRFVDALNERIGKATYWLVLVVAVISAANATVRYAFNSSSNAWLEVQWYLFAAIFLLCAGYTLKHNEHIRIDIITGRFSKRIQTLIDIFGGIFFLLPMTIIIMYLSWPMFMDSFLRWEQSSDAGGLLRWPVKLLVPVGFLLLSLQGISETLKRIAFLMGQAPDPTEVVHDHYLEQAGVGDEK